MRKSEVVKIDVELNFLKQTYSLTEEIAKKIIRLRTTINSNREIQLSYDELVFFLKNAMNYNDMQIWLLRKEFEGDSVSLNDSLTKFFELNDDKSILRLYDIEQNCNEKNIDDVRRSITDGNDGNHVLRLIKK